MAFHYSPGTGGFYDSEDFPPEKLPADAREITAELHAQLMDAQAEGAELVSDDDGMPIARPYEPDHLATLRRQRQALLAGSDWTQLPDAQATMAPERQAAWTAYRQALRDLPATTPDPANPAWPEEPA